MSVILEFLDEHWPKSVTLSFLDLIDSSLTLMKNHPEKYPEIHAPLRIRKCVLTKHNSLYYRITNNQLEILRIYDNRQDPDLLKFN